MKRRQTHPELTRSRIYQKGNRFYFFSAQPIENPKTRKVAKWHSLCDVEAGQLTARNLAAEIWKHNSSGHAGGDMPYHIEAFRLEELKRREKDRPREAARVKMFEEGNKEITRSLGVISKAFEDFNVSQVLPVDVANFVDQWLGQRTAQVYLSKLSKFFRWCVRRGLRSDNPCLNVRVDKPKKRKRYITHQEWHRIRDALLVGKDGRKTPSGPMIQAYADLCYLLYQRTTEIRLLKWSQIDMAAGVIRFTPTKTERSSGLSVAVPITQAVREVLDRLREADGKRLHSIYVIHNKEGQPYSSHGIGDAWERACERAGVEDATLKDLRAKAATDALNAGYTLAQIKVGLAHTDEAMSEEYIRRRQVDVSEIQLSLPSRG